MKYVVLWLEGPFQSWGSDSKFGFRSSGSFPSKSGIYGMILSGLGLSGEQTEFLQKISFFQQDVFSYKCKDKDGLTPTLTDFQMVGSGYDSKDNKDGWYKLLIPRKVDGTKPTNTGGSKMIYKEYLQNAYFAVIQESDDDFSKDIKKALEEPVYDIFLGRKNCIPSDVIFRDIFDSYEDAKRKVEEIAGEKNLSLEFLVSEKQISNESLVLKDVPIHFGAMKKYKERLVFIKRLNGDNTLTN